MKNRPAIFLIFCLFFCGLGETCAQVFPSFGRSRTGSSGMQFIKIGPDARSAGMAGSYITVCDDVAALYWNPAGITRTDTQRVHFQLGHTAYFAGVNMEYGGLVYRINDNTFIGASFQQLHTGRMDVTTEWMPQGTGETFRAASTAAGLSLGRVLTESFSFGISGKFLRESIAGIHTNTFVADFGFLYEVGLANTRFAVTVSNFGFNAEPGGVITRTTLQGVDTIGNYDKVNVPAVFRMGIAWDAVKRDFHLFTLTGQLNHPTDYNETYALAAEYTWRKTAFMRTGYEFGIAERGAPAFGFGVRYKRRFGMVSMDYGFAHRLRIGAVHRITLGLSLF